MRLIARCAIFAGEAGRIAPGETFDIAEPDGEVLVARGFAKLAPAEPQPEPAPDTKPEPEAEPVKRPVGRPPKAKSNVT